MRALNMNSATRALAASHCFSKCGEFAFETAFAVAVVSMTDADLFLIGLVYFFRYLPSAVFSPLGGWLADNADRKCTLVRVEMAKCLVALVFFALFSFSTPALVLVVLVAMCMTALDCLYVPTFRAYFPDIVEREVLSSINSGVQVVEDLSSIIGPLVFSAMVLLYTSEATFLFFAICLMLSSASLATLAQVKKMRRCGLRRLVPPA